MPKPAEANLVQTSEHLAKDRILEAIGTGTPFSVSELADLLAKKPAIGNSKPTRKELAARLVAALLHDGRIFEHPVGGRNRTLRYANNPADPKKYFTRSGLRSVQTLYAKLIKARISPADIINAAASKLDPPVSATPTRATTGTKWLHDALKYLQDFKAKRPAESVSLPDLFRLIAEPNGISLGEFHDGLRLLSDQNRVLLAGWTQPLYLLKEDRFALIVDKEIRYYVRTP